MKFLEKIVTHFTNHYSNDLQKITLVFPNKRPILFIKKIFREKLSKTHWTPRIITIEEFIEENSLLVNADPLILNWELYQIFKKYSNQDESFDQFYQWGEILLQDFNEIDKFAVNAKDVFQYLIDEKEIEQQFQYLSIEQIEIIKKFWKSFNPPNYSENQNHFIQIWKILFPVYETFRSELKNKGIGYPGMLYEEVTTKAKNGTLLDKYDKVFFAGFHILSYTEEKIFDLINKSKKGGFFWDIDSYYIDSPNHEAGRYLKMYIEKYPNILQTENSIGNQNQKIEIIEVSQTAGQLELTNQIIKQNNYAFNIDTVVVLPTEETLIPLMGSLEKNENQVYNITMGIPVKNSFVPSLIDSYIDCFKYYSISKSQFYYKPILKFLSNSFIYEIYTEQCESIIQEIKEENILYIDKKFASKHKLLDLFFESPTPLKVINNILFLLKEGYSKPTPETNFFQEIIFKTIESLETISQIISDNTLQLELQTVHKLLKKYIKGISVSLLGEPLEGLQIMGFLETRNIDFKNIIILNANEGILPNENFSNSFIPYHLRKVFELPIPEHSSSSWSYYFYRLFHKAENIHLLYNSTSTNYLKGEPSRYITQLKLETNYTILEKIHEQSFRISKTQEIVKKKDDLFQKYILDLTQEESKHKISPSALNVYLTCQLRFYFKYIEKIKENKLLMDETTPAEFGNLVHYSVENVYKLHNINFERNIVLEEDFPWIYENLGVAIKSAFAEVFKIQSLDFELEGEHLITYEVVSKIIHWIIDVDKKTAIKNKGFKILNIEKQVFKPYTIKANNKIYNINIGGYVDRIDQVKNRIKIIDFKTGINKNKLNFESIDDLFSRDTKIRKEYIFQIFLYACIYDDLIKSSSIISPHLLFVREFGKHNTSGNIFNEKTREVVEDIRTYKNEFENKLKILLEELFDLNHDFNQTTDINTCKNCEYKMICNR